MKTAVVKKWQPVDVHAGAGPVTRARRRAVSDGASSSFHCCSRDRRDACFTVSTDSAGLFGRATIPLPAILVLSHTQVWLPALHKLESRSDLSADSESRQQAATDQFKLSQETSARVLVLVGARLIVLSESRYITSVRYSESVVVRLSDSDQLPTCSQ